MLAMRECQNAFQALNADENFEAHETHEKVKTSQELRMLSSVTINCQVTKIVMNSGSQLSEL